jgi:hypothetical protein
MTPTVAPTLPRGTDGPAEGVAKRRPDQRPDQGALLLEAIFALFLLGVVALGTLGLLAHSLVHFELAESRGRALPVAGAWLDAAAAGEVDLAAVEAVGPGELRWGRDASGAPLSRLEFAHPRGGRWPLPWAPVIPPGETGSPEGGGSPVGGGP